MANQTGGKLPKKLNHFHGSARQGRSRGGRITTGETRRRPILITGGAGFLGSNLAHRLLMSGEPVLVLDNLSRIGARQAVSSLARRRRGELAIRTGDLRDRRTVRRAVEGARAIIHLAGPTNMLGEDGRDRAATAGLLDAIRRAEHGPTLVTVSRIRWNDSWRSVPIRETNLRYELEASQNAYDQSGKERGWIDLDPSEEEREVLDCSEGYSFPACVLRANALYGPYQGLQNRRHAISPWISKGLLGQPIPIPGTGKQVRDFLYVDDFVEALLSALRHMAALSGRVLNVGGGERFSLSALESVLLIQRLLGYPLRTKSIEADDAGCPYLVSNGADFRSRTGWRPRIAPEQGFAELTQWIASRHQRRPARSPWRRSERECPDFRSLRRARLGSAAVIAVRR